MMPILKIKEINGENTIIDNKGKVIFNDIHDVKESSFEPGLIEFMTINNEFSCINSSGLFFEKFHYEDYDMVSEMLPSSFILKTEKEHKYGIIKDDINNFKILFDCIYDNIEYLSCNKILLYGDLLKIKKNESFFLVHIDTYNCKTSKVYDYIYTPIQLLDKYIVFKDKKYGFIDKETLEEVVEPKFDSIEQLCEEYNCDVNKYTSDLYITDNSLKMTRAIANHRSYYIDENKILQGEWGGCEEYISNHRTGEIAGYDLYYNHNGIEYIGINRYGYFYDLFDCRIYDVVVRIDNELFIAYKNAKCGLINNEFKVLLALCYDDIQLVKFRHLENVRLFVVTCKDGMFFYNPDTGMRTSMFEYLSWSTCYNQVYENFLVYREKGKYGLISYEGYKMTEAQFEMYNNKPLDDDMGYKFGCGKFDRVYFKSNINNSLYDYYICDNKFYGVVPIDDYDLCVKVHNHSGFLYLTRKNGKYGILNDNFEKIDMPLMDSIIFSPNIVIMGRRPLLPLSMFCMITQVNNKFYLYDIRDINRYKKVNLILSDCDEIEIIKEENELNKRFPVYHEPPYFRFTKDRICGYVNEDGKIISDEIYDKIENLIVSKASFYTTIVSKICFYITTIGGKCGLLNSNRKILLDCVYDEISDVTIGYSRIYVVAVENGETKKIKFSLEGLRIYEEDEINENISSEEPQEYLKYSGSYAQDEMGYSDDDIDTIFEGDPDAYWNID